MLDGGGELLEKKVQSDSEFTNPLLLHLNSRVIHKG